MPLESFPLPDPAPDPAEAARLLALTQTALEGPIAALSDAAGGGLTQTAGQLAAIQKRLLASAQARLKATGRDLGVVLDKLHQGAQAALAETAASLALTAQRAGRRTPYSAPDATADVYWCVRLSGGSLSTVVAAPVGMPPVAPVGATVSGPYQTQGEAQTACGAVSAPPAVPGPALPPAQPSRAAETPGQRWWVIYPQDGSHCYVMPGPAVGYPTFPPDTNQNGPYDTQAQAQAVCAGQPPPPASQPVPTFPLPTPAPSPGPSAPAPQPTVPVSPAPPQPVAPAAPQPALPAPSPLPVEGCTLPDAFQGGIPLPGTVEFCAVQDQVLAWFGAAGDAVWKWVLDATDPAAINAALGELQHQSTGFLSSTFTAIMVPIAQWIVSLSAPVMQRVHDAILCLRQLVGASMRCNVQLLLSLLGLKTVISFTKEINFGTLGGTFVVAQDTFDLALGQFEKVLDYLIAYVCPAEIPSQGEAAEAFLRGLISREYYECLMRLHGMAPETFEPFLLARSERLNPKEAVQWVRRHGGTPEEEDDALRRVGFYDGVEASRYKELYDELPTIGDHLEWLRKNVFQQKYVRDFHLLDGFGTAQDIADAGYEGWTNHPDTPRDSDFWGRFGGQLRALGMTKENAALHYAAHWLNPSFTQLFEMTQRLRPGRVDPSLTFTRDDLLRVMQEQDVGVYFRQRLEAVSHPVINLTLCMKLYGLATFSAEEFKQRLGDLGFGPADAEVIQRGLSLDVARLRASSGHGWNPASIARAVGLGLMADEEATQRMAQIGYTAKESEDMIGRAVTERDSAAKSKAIGRTITKAAAAVTGAYRLGIVDRDSATESLKVIGYPEDVASNALLVEDIQQKMALTRAGMACVRKALSKGKVKPEEALEQLKGLGVGQERAQELVQLWGVQCAAAPPQATAAQILRWVAQGLLPAERARERLINLGWGDPDLMLQLSAAQAALIAREGRAEALVQRHAQGQAKELERLQQQARTQAQRLQQRIRQVTPPTKLISWFVSDLIGPAYFAERMEAMGITGQELEDYLREAERRRTEARARAARAPG